MKFQKNLKGMEFDANYGDYVKEVYKDGNKRGPPLDIDWENARLVVQFLHTFFETKMKFSGSVYVASNFKNQLILLTKTVDTKSKFNKYWTDPRETNVMLTNSNVLDSRYWLQFARDLWIFIRCIYCQKVGEAY